MKRLVTILAVALLAPAPGFAQIAPDAEQTAPDYEQTAPDDYEQPAPDDYKQPASDDYEQPAPGAEKTSPDFGQTAPGYEQTAPVAEQTTPDDEQAAPVAEQTSAPAAGSYRLGAGDKLRVTVFGETDLTGEYDIAADGSMTFPLIGALNAMDLTPEQLSHAIATRLQRGYLRDPSVVVSVIAYRPFYILGEVEHPGAYPYAPNLDAMSAVAVAGGFTYRANRRRVFIRHAGQTDEQPYTLRQAVPIQPGDTVRVGERFF